MTALQRLGLSTVALIFAVYRQVRRRLKRLSIMQKIVRKPESLSIYSTEYLYDIRYRWSLEHPSIPFRVGNAKGQPWADAEYKKARDWLLQVVKMQSAVIEKPQMFRLLRSAIEKEGRSPEEEAADPTSDLERLYKALTNADLPRDSEEDIDDWDFEYHLDTAFMMTLHHDYATKHAAVLEKLREVTGRGRNRSLSPTERIIQRMLSKIQSSSVDEFACAIALSAIKAMPEEDQACPICQNAYLDLHNFSVEDLIADYPVGVKYCGHVFGKSCLETWIGTPLSDPAKYPVHTCPTCRTDIEGCDTPKAPIALYKHVAKDETVKMFRKVEELEQDECREGILRAVSEEIALKNLDREVEGMRILEMLEKAKLDECKDVLARRLKELLEEKKMWGFRGEKMEELWQEIEDQWMKSEMGA
jgi:hypothetical protein